MMQLALGLVALFAIDATPPASSGKPPNFLWICVEDVGPHLGCYGDTSVSTPVVDELAASGVLFRHAFAVAPVCAPSRSSIVTGMYPTTLGTQHMRCEATPSSSVRCLPALLRDAGYYCSNNDKTDYNFDPAHCRWSESSTTAHWRNRRPNQPFFSVFHLGCTHESAIWRRDDAHRQATPHVTDAERIDVDDVLIPPYYPDTAETRRDWANYLECIVEADHLVAEILDELAADGEADNTFVFFFSDHGVGLPRAKRWTYDSGLRTPLVVRPPKSWRSPAERASVPTEDRLVSLIDLAPTVLRLAGLKPPSEMQGRSLFHDDGPPRDHVVGFRDRMDSRYDLVRTVRDRRYRYIRNYMPWMPYAQPIAYAETGETMQALRRASALGETPPAATLFMSSRKPVEELYDIEADPHETLNLCDAPTPEAQAVLRTMRSRLRQWEIETRDTGLIPESLLRRQERRTGDCQAVLAQESVQADLRRIRQLLDHQKPPSARRQQCVAALSADSSAVRYWALLSLIDLDRVTAPSARLETPDLQRLTTESLKDPEPLVRIAAAHFQYASRPDVAEALLVEEMAAEDPWVRLSAVNALDELQLAGAEVVHGCQDRLRRDSNPYVTEVAQRILDRNAAREPTPGERSSGATVP